MSYKVDMSLNDLTSSKNKSDSKVDMSLDDIVSQSKKKRGVGKPKNPKFNGAGFVTKPTARSKPTVDLRYVIADKQRSTITDLRTKIKPKAIYTSKFASKQASKSNPTTPKSNNPGVRPRLGSLPQGEGLTLKSRSRRSDPGPLNYKMPSFEEAKKITVTVPGVLRPNTTSQEHRREERLAAAIARSREGRSEAHTRGREEFLASTITSAMRGGAHMDRGRSGLGSTFVKLESRRYSRSPSPPTGGGGLYQEPHPVHRGGMSRGSMGQHTREGITTLTSMIIQNLSDTVSKNDVAELCRAVGPLEGIQMPAPGVAEIVFKYKDDALEAFKKYNQRNLDGQPMVCRLQPASRAKLATGGFNHHRPLSHAYSDDLYSQSSNFY